MRRESHCFENPHNLMLQRFGQGIKLFKDQTECLSTNSVPLSKIYNMPMCVYFMDTRSTLQSANDVDLKAINALSMKDVRGLTVNEMANKVSAEMFMRQDAQLFSRKMMVINEAPFTRKDEVSFPVLTFKFPWYDAGNLLKGVFGISVFTDHDNEYGVSLAESLGLLTKTGILDYSAIKNQAAIPGTVLDHIYFTKKEKLILLQLLRGKTAREIAGMLSRSQRTIEKHIENMKLKSGTSTKSELIEKLYDQYSRL